MSDPILRRLVAGVRIRPQVSGTPKVEPRLTGASAIVPAVALDANAIATTAYRLTCAVAAFATTGGDVAFNSGSTLSCAAASYTTTGGAMTFVDPAGTLTCATGVFTTTGGSMTANAPAANLTLACSGSVFVTTGGALGFVNASGVLPTPIGIPPIGMSFNNTANPLTESPFVGTPIQGFDPDAAFPGDSKAADFTIGAGQQASARSLFQSYLASSVGMTNPVIEIHPSIILRGPFSFPKLTGSNWGEVRPTTYASLSAGDGFDLVNDPQYCFTFESQNAANGEAWHFDPQGGPWVLTGWIGQLPPSGPGLSTATWARISTSEGTQPGTLANRPSKIVLRKFNLDAGDVTTDARRGLWINATDVLIEDFRCVKWHSSGNECQGIYTPYGAERVVIRNGPVQAAGEPIFKGGAALPGDDPAWIPKDFLQENLTLYSYPEDGSSIAWVAKNDSESKSIERDLWVGCDFTKLRHDGQIFAYAVKCNRENTGGNNQGGVNNRSTDAIFWFCRLHKVPAAWLFNGRESGSGNYPATGNTRIDARFILCDDLDTTSPYQLIAGNNTAAVFIANDNTDLVLDHWTIANVSSRVDKGILFAGSTPTGKAATRLVLTNSILPMGTYGAIYGNGGTEGTAALAAFCVGSTVHHNWFYRRPGGSTSTAYPAGNTFAANQAAVLPNAAGGSDFDVDPSIAGAASDGRDPGCIPAWIFARIP